MPSHRVTQFRTATTYLRRRSRDRFDHVTMFAAVFAAGLADVFLVIPVLLAIGSTAFFAGVLVCASANLVVLRSVWVYAQYVIRPRVFDREQQNNEIVPPSTDRSHTRA